MPTKKTGRLPQPEAPRVDTWLVRLYVASQSFYSQGQTHMSLQKLRSGVKQFDAQWNGTVPTDPVFDNSPIILIRVSRKSQWWNDPKYLSLGLTAQRAVDGLFSREQDEHAWVYVVRHNRPRTRERVTHGYIVCDDQRFPV